MRIPCQVNVEGKLGYGGMTRYPKPWIHPIRQVPGATRLVSPTLAGEFEWNPPPVGLPIERYDEAASELPWTGMDRSISPGEEARRSPA